MITDADRAALAALDVRLNAILPDVYQGRYDAVAAAPMGSAALQHDPDGRIAWDRMWRSFCDLAMAGGPPHKGRLLESGTPADVAAVPARHRAVVDELCRGVRMVTGLDANEAPRPGWIRVQCRDAAMAGWLLRAITTENVAVRSEGQCLDLPAAPSYRPEREIKNVVTVIAKTTHYWNDHIPVVRQRAIGRIFTRAEEQNPLVTPAFDADPEELSRATSEWAASAERVTGLEAGRLNYSGWCGVSLADEATAVWLMRALIVNHVLARREESVLFLPIDPASGRGEQVTHVLASLLRLNTARRLVHP